MFDVSFQKIMEIKILNYYIFNNTVYAQDNLLLERKQLNITPTPPPVFEDRSTNIRLNVEWPRAIRAFSKNPLLGTGYSSISLATDNDYLRALGEVGFLGFISFSLIFVKLIEVLIKAYRKSVLGGFYGSASRNFYKCCFYRCVRGLQICHYLLAYCRFGYRYNL